jgi:hypothetical protein
MKLLWTASILAAVACTWALAQASRSLQGAWRVTETTNGKTQKSNKSPQPGLYMFTAKHYSVMTVNSEKARPNFEDAAKATADQLRDAWGPFTANSGTYEVSGSTLTLRPLVAKAPGAMTGGNVNTFTIQLNGNNLSLTQTANQKGPVQNGNTVKLTRAE